MGRRNRGESEALCMSQAGHRLSWCNRRPNHTLEHRALLPSPIILRSGQSRQLGWLCSVQSFRPRNLLFLYSSIPQGVIFDFMVMARMFTFPLQEVLQSALFCKEKRKFLKSLGRVKNKPKAPNLEILKELTYSGSQLGIFHTQRNNSQVVFASSEEEMT